MNNFYTEKVMLLKEWMKKNKVSLQQLAKLMGVSMSVVAKISSGHRRCSIDNAVKIEKATGGKVTREEAIWPEDFIKENDDGSQQKLFIIKRVNEILKQLEGE